MSKFYISHKFRLKPTKEQTAVLENWCHTNRFIWNHFLAANKTKYESDKKFIFYNEMATSVPSLKTICFFERPTSAITTSNLPKTRISNQTYMANKIRVSAFQIKEKRRFAFNSNSTIK